MNRYEKELQEKKVQLAKNILTVLKDIKKDLEDIKKVLSNE